MSYDDFRGLRIKKYVYTYNSHCHGFAIQTTMETKKIVQNIQLHIRIDFLNIRHKRKFIFSRY